MGKKHRKSKLDNLDKKKFDGQDVIMSFLAGAVMSSLYWLLFVHEHFTYFHHYLGR